MHPIDWIFLFAPIALVIGVAIYTRRYVKNVADFLAAGRCAGRYLLANSRGEADSGLSRSIAIFESIMVAGFVLDFWGKLQIPIVMLFGIAGFVVYRLRETRAMTMAQFFEMRYSRRFRLFMGGLAFLSGILNYGIFPAVSAHFFIYFLQLPASLHIGAFQLSTALLLMVSYLSCTVFMVLFGGQVTLMVIDCIEGIVSHLIYIAIAIAVLFVVSLPQVAQVMESSPAGHSRVNPFDTAEVPDFNIWFMLMGLFIRIYNTSAFQHRQGFIAAARTPHEGRMGNVLGEWRGYARAVMLLLLGICALTYLEHPAFSSQAASIHRTLDAIPSGYLQKQMTIPIALRYLLPTGIKGLFCAIMIMGLFAGDAAHLHSWGSILIQDVVMPLRKRAFSPVGHMWALRFAIVGVAVWAICFSLFFRQTQYIMLWWLLAGAVFTSGAGAAIIGGLYWRKGTLAGAWAGAISGSLLALIGIGCGSFWPEIRNLLLPAFTHFGRHLPQKFFFNNAVSAFIAAISAATIYIVVSLLTCRRDYNLDRMLHRGEYAVEASGRTEPSTRRHWLSLRRILIFDEHFTRRDKFVGAGILAWSLLLMLINLIATGSYFLIHRWPASWWTSYWFITAIGAPFAIAIVTLIWFGIGGVRDLRDFFVDLRNVKRDSRDDGRVADEMNLSDQPGASAVTASDHAVQEHLTTETSPPAPRRR
jgi:SSS family solute:Na+ symporter